MPRNMRLKSMKRKTARKKLINLKCTEWEIQRFKSRANRYGATLSQWMRDAALYWKPTKSQLMPLDEADPDTIMTIPDASKTPTPAEF